MRKLLIVIDMQNDFIDAALGTKEAVSIVDAVKEKIRSYPAEDVIATMDTHGENYMDTQEGKYLPVPHCIRGTEGWKIRPDIEELLTGAKIYEKPTFGSIDLAQEISKIAAGEDIGIEIVRQEYYLMDYEQLHMFEGYNSVVMTEEEFREKFDHGDGFDLPDGKVFLGGNLFRGFHESVIGGAIV